MIFSILKDRIAECPRYRNSKCVLPLAARRTGRVVPQSAAALSNLGLKGLVIGNGILTTEDEAQAWARARISEGDKGGGAARACLDLIALRKRLRVGLGA